METKRNSFIKSLDWVTIAIYLVLVICGWFSVTGASYNYGDTDFFSFATRSGKQMIWIFCSFGIGFILLMLDDRLYDMLAYVAYIGMVLLLIATIFLSHDIKGSHSWLTFGPVSLQPAEFAKCATALALAKFMNSYSFNMKRTRDMFLAMGLIFLPMLVIIGENETGSSLVYLAFFFMLYREGMPGAILFFGLCAIVFFIVAIRFADVMLFNTPTPVGSFAVLLMIMIFAAGMIWVYLKRFAPVRNILGIGLLVTLVSFLISNYVIPFNIIWVMLVMCIVMVGYLFYLWLSEREGNYLMIAIFAAVSVAFLFSSNYVFNSVLEPHQQVRIKVVLGMEQDLTGAGYNVNQSKIAIGSGGLTGKGFLNGTQTKLKYVPEQDTDFIFCTVGEEQGFRGSAFVIILYAAFIIRLVIISERQYSTFGRVYGYCCASIFFVHLLINVGMVLGLTPVIGIPLPFFSYGGSSLWGFTILLFIFLRIDAARKWKV
jgi:rod shape determining protein RodA